MPSSLISRFCLNYETSSWGQFYSFEKITELLVVFVSLAIKVKNVKTVINIAEISHHAAQGGVSIKQ